MTAAPPLLEAEKLRVHFPVGEAWSGSRRRWIRAVDNVSFTLDEGETLGLVGESGSGKSTLGRAVLRLAPLTAGRVRLSGIDITRLSERRLRPLRRHAQIVFQDPFGSLNPRLPVLQVVGEAMRVHRLVRTRQAMAERVRALLDRVGLPPDAADRYPHEFSGGQRQRIAIARALALNPRLLVADEPLSALDVSVQTQIVNLFRDLQREFGLAYLFIAHDLRMVEYLSHRTAVMYLGRFVELGPTPELFARPLHPYTRALLASVPVPDPERPRPRPVLVDEPLEERRGPTGCTFQPRCPEADANCVQEIPELQEVEPGRWVACVRRTDVR